MSADDFEAWTKSTLSGEQLYFYGDQDDATTKSSQSGGGATA